MTEQANEENGTPGKKRTILKILLMVLGLILVIGLSVGLTLFFTRGWGGNVDPADAPLEQQGGLAYYMALTPEFIVTYTINSRQRFLRTDLSVRTRDTRVLDVLTQHMPVVRNAIIETLGEQEFDDLQSEVGREQLVAVITDSVNEVLVNITGEPGIDAVLFTNYVVQ